jgi:hypothetical protein
MTTVARPDPPQSDAEHRSAVALVALSAGGGLATAVSGVLTAASFRCSRWPYRRGRTCLSVLHCGSDHAYGREHHARPALANSSACGPAPQRARSQ